MSSSNAVIPRAAARKLVVATIAGAVLLALSTLFAPDRVWANLLVGSYYLITLGLGGVLFIALTNVCGGGWQVAFRRVPEAMTGVLPVAGVILLGTLAVRLGEYGWHHRSEEHTSELQSH